MAVAVACALATPLGYALMDITSDDFQGGINGFAAGALLVMLVDSMIPDATEEGRPNHRARDHARIRPRRRPVAGLISRAGRDTPCSIASRRDSISSSFAMTRDPDSVRVAVAPARSASP